MKKEEVEAVYEQLRQELGDEEVEKEVEEARKHLEKHVRGFGISVSWEDAVLYLAAERARIKGLRETNISIKYSGERWKIYYYPIGSFEDELPLFGEFLEDVEEKGEEVFAIIPNMGLVPTSIVLGTSFQGIKGFAVITKMKDRRRSP